MIKVLYIFISLFLFGCQGMPSKKPPIHLNPNMDDVERYDAQEKQYFYEKDDRTKRNPIEGTIPYGFYKDDNPDFFIGKNEDGEYVKNVSEILDVDENFIKRGQDRFNIYCSVCHGYSGIGNGLVAQSDQYNVIVTSILSETLDDKSDGYFYDIISNGKNNMKGYSGQITEEDRWAIVTYIRALRYMEDNGYE
ncbi:MAG: quinol:cytochrome C oxidoreductase [Candidatus Marinimicrobia bacterium]|nr:quinol:cytochrome C oxidoreductase [Candidatus Neomarinimicrobiota bacterium]|tara:strand:+ start:2703 stop:3281 length:579 start_codon:yes stop_codon:yes gene_type:complete